MLFSAIPQGWATIRSAKIQYASFFKTSSRVRRLGVTANLVLHDGRVTERGTHDERMADPGNCAELFDLQARAYTNPESGT
ncbi:MULTISPECIES: hypothetical protein [Pseudonocardia]|uniref:hypothetical protein n=1 Tax=Pseudonocardia TaxID=1847 RepID=UPI00117A933F|nr:MULTISPECIES: hypothetical protein [Pseudonocardia]